MLLPIDATNVGEATMGRKLAYSCASEWTCALATWRQQKSRFRACHHAACMRIAMATHDRPADVTAESSDVSDRRHRSEGRGLTCRSAPTCHSTRSTACPDIRGSPPSSLGQLSFKLQRGPSQAQLPNRSKEACGQAKEQERRFSEC